MDAKLYWCQGALLAAVLASLLLCGCGSRAAGALDAGQTGPGGTQDLAGPLQDPAAAEFPGLPALPTGTLDAAGPRSVSEFDNIQLGNEDWSHSTTGAEYSGSTLVLYGPATDYGAWGTWQWSGFTNGLIPNSVTIDTTLDPGRKYWLLVSNYSVGHWRMIGPINTKTYTYNFELGYNYVSPGNSVYVTIIADKSNTAIVKQLNLRANRDIDAPSPPTGVHAEDIMGHQANIRWNKNPDKDVLGYKLYSGPNDNFIPGDPGVTMLKDFTFLDLQYLSTGLLADTLYHYKLTAYDVAFNESRPSDPCDFTTLANQAPVAAYSFAPGFVQVDRDVTFDPTATTDAGDDINNDIFKWDFDNDGNFDQQTTGPKIITHQYSQRRTYQCRLLVSDGQLTDEVTKTIQVSFRYDYHNYGRSKGNPAMMTAASTDEATGRIAVSANRTDHAVDGPGVFYYAGGNWSWIPATGLPGDSVVGVCLTASGVAALSVDMLAGQWYVSEFNSTVWTPVWSGASAGLYFMSGKLAAAPNGKYCVATVTYNEPAFGSPPIFILRVCHETAVGGTRSSDQTFSPDGSLYPYDIVRDNSASYCASVVSDVSLTKLDDATTATSSQQASGPASSIGLYDSPGTPGNICWVVAEVTGSMIWGDNYGAANGPGQVVGTPEAALMVTGIRSDSDNNAEFYWIGQDAEHHQYVRGYDSSALGGSGESYDLWHGYGVATFGGGGAFTADGKSGVYFAIQDYDDGELDGYFYDSGAQLRKDRIYYPTDDSSVLGYSWPVIFPDDSLNVLCEQRFPKALRASAPTLADNPAVDQLGVGDYVVPNAACATGNGKDFMVASASIWNDVVVTHFDTGATDGNEMLVVVGADTPVLERNLATGTIMLAYLKNGKTEVWARTGDGSSWGPESQVYSNSVTIMQLSLRSRSDGGWGIAVGLDNDEVWLTEDVGGAGVWSSPVLLSNTVINDYCGLGLGYSAAGDCSVAIERGVPQELWLGERKAGETDFTWSLLDATTNGYVRGTALFYENGPEPVVFYYLHIVWTDLSGVYVLENIDNSWVISHFDFIFFESPLGNAVDSNGNIVISGVMGNPADAVYSVIWR